MQASLRHVLSRLRREAALPHNDSDEALLRRFVCRSDEDAFAALVARHGPMVSNVCLRVLGDSRAAEDAFQATFFVLARKAGALLRPAMLANWLYGVAHRIALKARAAAARRREVSLSESTTEPSDRRPDPLAMLTGRDLLRALDDEVHRLPAAYRLPVVLCCLQGLTIEEAAKRLDWTTGSVKGRLERGRAKLQKLLVRRGLTFAAALAAAEVARAVAIVAASASSATFSIRAIAFARGAERGFTGALPQASNLATRELRAMSLRKLKLVGALVAVLAVVGTGLGWRNLAPEGSLASAGAPDKQPPIRWEYKTLQRSDWAPGPSVEGLAPADSADKLTDGLNKLGEQGWELVAIEPDRHVTPRGSAGPATYIFKRRK
jgi:RNA polymerase sigma factor (sigma-70 family)